MKVNLEVSNIAGTIKTSTGSIAYQLGTRNASTLLRLRDGETQVLAGLISDAERSSANKLPGLGQLPFIGRLFGSTREEASRNEIVLLITPTIIRNLIRPDLDEAEFYGGTASTVSDKSLQLRTLTIDPLKSVDIVNTNRARTPLDEGDINKAVNSDTLPVNQGDTTTNQPKEIPVSRGLFEPAPEEQAITTAPTN
jgi:Flp pilus assembly secretin CpaC